MGESTSKIRRNECVLLNSQRKLSSERTVYSIAHQDDCAFHSSFNMTRGGDEDIQGGAPIFFRHPKGGLLKIRGSCENLYTSKPTGKGGGGL